MSTTKTRRTTQLAKSTALANERRASIRTLLKRLENAPMMQDGEANYCIAGSLGHAQELLVQALFAACEITEEEASAYGVHL